MFLIVQNDPQCPAGSCAALLAAAGYPYVSVAAYRGEPLPELGRLSGIIVLGGEMGVHDTEQFPYLLTVGSFLTAALQAGTPLLGICLGGQLVAKAAGGVVSSPSPHGEQGVCGVILTEDGAADPLFAGVPTPFLTFQLHDDSFTLPPGASLLASSTACPVQAFRLGSAYALQFHPEVDRAMVFSWGSLFTPSKDFLSGFLVSETSFNAASRAILSNFLSLAAAYPRP